MGKSLTQLLQGNAAPVWLDFFDYAGALFAPNGIPWFDDAAFAAFHGKAQSLLRSDVTSLPLARVAAALLSSRPDLAAAMKAKSRPGYPLRRLLEDDSLRLAVTRLLRPLAAASADTPLALVLPSPRCWLALAYQAAHGLPLEPEMARDGDEIDGAAVYVADFLRGFSEGGVDVVMLEELEDDGPDSTQALSWYDPIFKTARHYRWEVGLLDPGGVLPGDEDARLDFLIAPSPGAIPVGIGLVPSRFWQDGKYANDVPGQFTYGVVPADAVPETVLERIASLRQRT